MAKTEIILGQDGAEQVIITRLLKVSKVQYINELPHCWPMLEELVAYVLNLSGEEWEWMNSKGKPIGMDSVIWEHVSYRTASYSLLMANVAGSGQLGWWWESPGRSDEMSLSQNFGWAMMPMPHTQMPGLLYLQSPGCGPPSWLCPV